MGGVDAGAHTGLGAALAALLSRTGARVARLLDGRTSAVMATAGPDSARDTGVAVLAGWAVHAAASEGGLTNLVLVSGEAVHLLQPVEQAGVLVHLRFDLAQADLAGAGAVLAEPGFQDAVRAALHCPVPPAAVPPTAPGPGMQVPELHTAPGGPRTAGFRYSGAQDSGSQYSGSQVTGFRLGAPPPAVPGARTDPGIPAPGPAPSVPPVRAASTGALAVLALDAAVPAPTAGRPDQGVPVPAVEVPAPPYPMPAVRALPRRAAARSVLRAAAPLQEAIWSYDDRTLQRVLTGLRNLA